MHLKACFCQHASSSVFGKPHSSSCPLLDSKPHKKKKNHNNWTGPRQERGNYLTKLWVFEISLQRSVETDRSGIIQGWRGRLLFELPGSCSRGHAVPRPTDCLSGRRWPASWSCCMGSAGRLRRCKGLLHKAPLGWCTLPSAGQIMAGTTSFYILILQPFLKDCEVSEWRLWMHVKYSPIKWVNGLLPLRTSHMGSHIRTKEPPSPSSLDGYPTTYIQHILGKTGCN